MQARAWKSDEDIIRANPVLSKHRILFHVSDDEPGQVVIRRSVQARHFGSLPSCKRATVLSAPCRDTGDDSFHDGRIQLAERDVVVEEKRTRTLDEDVVDAMIDEVATDGVVTAGFDGNLYLRANAVRTRYQDRFAQPGRKAQHPAESARVANHTLGEG